MKGSCLTSVVELYLMVLSTVSRRILESRCFERSLNSHFTKVTGMRDHTGCILCVVHKERG